MSFYKPRRPLGAPVSPRAAAPYFEPVPVPPPSYLELPLSTVLPDIHATAAKAGRLVFHCVGDTGGVEGTEMEDAVAAAMEAQVATAADGRTPAFFYHLGDVVYYNGVSTDYVWQFYEPYQYYPAPIFAIPGNHDGDRRVRKGDDPDGEPSLYGFFKNFCGPTPDHYFKHRPTMTQPYCYWTLAAPFVRIVGLYSNVDGLLDTQQQLWLCQQLASCPKDKWLLLAVHHPCFSLDATHGGYVDVLDAIDSAAAAAHRWPDAVLSGHVHDYQRFARTVHGHAAIPYIIAGAGGYAHTPRLIHRLQRDLDLGDLPFQTTRSDVKLEAYNCEDSGYLRITAEPSRLVMEYFAVPFDGEAPREAFDVVEVSASPPKTP